MAIQPVKNNSCFLHDSRSAVETCEVCQRPVCGSCLWYADSGERLCPIHADEFRRKGKVVAGPEAYASGIAFSELSAQQQLTRQPPAPYRGNSNDVMALVSLIMGGAAILSCAGYAWLLPILAFMLGLAAWLNSKLSVNPGRTTWYAGIGMTSGGVFLAGFLLMMTCCGMFYIVSIASTINTVPPPPTPIFP